MLSFAPVRPSCPETGLGRNTATAGQVLLKFGPISARLGPTMVELGPSAGAVGPELATFGPSLWNLFQILATEASFGQLFGNFGSSPNPPSFPG